MKQGSTCTPEVDRTIMVQLFHISVKQKHTIYMQQIIVI